MTAFFPGSRVPITPPAGLRDVLDGLKGTVHPLSNGQSVELFTITDLAQVLNRSAVTIRKWEQKGYIPRATYVKPGVNQDPRGRRRLYSREQVEALLQIAREEGILHDLHRQITNTQFRAKAYAAFKRIAGE